MRTPCGDRYVLYFDYININILVVRLYYGSVGITIEGNG